MTKKNETRHAAPFNFGESPLIKGTERKLVEGYQKLENEDVSPSVEDEKGAADDLAVVPAAPNVQQAAVYRTARMFHKERTQDVLVHCPESLHRRLRERKDHIWDEYGERVTINNMVIEAIALWLDQQDGKKVNTTT